MCCCRCVGGGGGRGGGGAALSSVNPFRLCAGLRALGYLMLPLVAAIAGTVYYAVVVAAWGPRIVKEGNFSALALFIVILFNALLVMVMWCYLRVVFSDPGTVPDGWRPITEGDVAAPSSSPNGDDGSDARDAVSVDTGVRHCARCQNWKPPRCHHCSVTDACLRWIITVYGLSIVSELAITSSFSFSWYIHFLRLHWVHLLSYLTLSLSFLRPQGILIQPRICL